MSHDEFQRLLCAVAQGVAANPNFKAVTLSGHVRDQAAIVVKTALAIKERLEAEQCK